MSNEESKNQVIEDIVNDMKNNSLDRDGVDKWISEHIEKFVRKEGLPDDQEK